MSVGRAGAGVRCGAGALTLGLPSHVGLLWKTWAQGRVWYRGPGGAQGREATASGKVGAPNAVASLAPANLASV